MKSPHWLLHFLPIAILVFFEFFFQFPTYLCLALTSFVLVAFQISKSRKILSIFLNSLFEIRETLFLLASLGILLGLWYKTKTILILLHLLQTYLQIPNLLVTAFLFSSFLSLWSGSSWSTAATLGVVFLELGKSQGYPLEWVSGAIISGAYVGDKLSPFSDTTNLASSSAGVNLYDHIQNMLPLTAISFLISGVFYYGFDVVMATFSISPVSLAHAPNVNHFASEENYFYLASPIFILASIFLRRSPYKTMLLGAVITTVVDIASRGFHSEIVMAAYSFERGGFLAVYPTILLIVFAMLLGASWEGVGLKAFFHRVMAVNMKTPKQLQVSVIFFSVSINLSTADQYLSIFLSGKLFKKLFAKFQIPSLRLSRLLEDFGTLTSALIPWNSCGMFLSTALGVMTTSYAPFCFFLIFNFLISLISIFFLPFSKKESQSRT